MLKNAKGLYLSALLKWLISHRQLTQFAGNINFESSVGTTIEKIYNYGTEGWPIADSFQNILNFICYSIPTGIFLVQNQKKKIQLYIPTTTLLEGPIDTYDKGIEHKR